MSIENRHNPTEFNIEKDIQNVYASDIKGDEIHISQAQSGRKGYFCLGCKKEMQAVISHKSNRISYFRHDFSASKGLPKCTFSDESYRHKLAKEFLIRTKTIKVPSLYKYPPRGVTGNALLISEAQFIHGVTVKPELYFYENEESEICWSKSAFSEDTKHLLLKPDIAFFNELDKPILLVEIVVTHKITESKQLDLKRLGINTVQVTIPKDSPENIERVFETTNRTKWIYNYEQEITDYIQLSNSHSEGILPIDEDQRKLFEESIKCRAAQINNLIRAIRKCLGSEQFRNSSVDFESEISRVERNTERERDVYFNICRENEDRINQAGIKLRERIHLKYAERRNRIDSEFREFKKEEGEFLSYHTRHESKLINDRDGIGDRVAEKYRGRREKTEGRYKELEERYLRKRVNLEGDIKSAENSIGELRDDFSAIEQRIKDLHRTIRDMEFQIKEFDKNEEYERELIEREQKNRESIELRYNGIRESVEKRFMEDRKQIEERFREIRVRTDNEVEGRTYRGNGITDGYKKYIVDLENIPDLLRAQTDNRRYKKAAECLNKASFKNWPNE
jgi:hypothetical protein